MSLLVTIKNPPAGSLRNAGRKFSDDAKARMGLALLAIESELTKTLSAPPAPSSPDDLLEPGGVGGLRRRQHGATTLIHSVVRQVTATPGQLIGTVGSPVFWLPVHEYGAVIHAKGNALRIPTKKKGKFLFVKSVTIPARRPFGTAADNAKQRVMNILGNVTMFVREANA